MLQSLAVTVRTAWLNIRKKKLHGTHIAFMCSVLTFNLYSINRLILYKRGGECLLLGMH